MLLMLIGLKNISPNKVGIKTKFVNRRGDSYSVSA
jgi:hypothetical protein